MGVALPILFSRHSVLVSRRPLPSFSRRYRRYSNSRRSCLSRSRQATVANCQVCLLSTASAILHLIDHEALTTVVAAVEMSTTTTKIAAGSHSCLTHRDRAAWLCRWPDIKTVVIVTVIHHTPRHCQTTVKCPFRVNIRQRRCTPQRRARVRTCATRRKHHAWIRQCFCLPHRFSTCDPSGRGAKTVISARRPTTLGWFSVPLPSFDSSMTERVATCATSSTALAASRDIATTSTSFSPTRAIVGLATAVGRCVGARHAAQTSSLQSSRY